MNVDERARARVEPGRVKPRAHAWVCGGFG